MMTMKNASAATVIIDLPRCTTMHPNGFGFSTSFPNTFVSFLTGAPPAARMVLRHPCPPPPPPPPPPAAAPAPACSNAADSGPPDGLFGPPAADGLLGPLTPFAPPPPPPPPLLLLVDAAAVAAARMAEALPRTPPLAPAPPPASSALSGAAGGLGGRFGPPACDGLLGPLASPCCSRRPPRVMPSSSIFYVSSNEPQRCELFMSIDGEARGAPCLSRRARRRIGISTPHPPPTLRREKHPNGTSCGGMSVLPRGALRARWAAPVPARRGLPRFFRKQRILYPTLPTFRFFIFDERKFCASLSNLEQKK